MDGITILAEKVINCEPTFLVRFFFIISSSLAIASIILCLFCFLPERDFKLAKSFALLALGCGSLAFFAHFPIKEAENTFSHYEYKVLIDDSVPLNEFNEKYEILDQEGQIYTVIEREVEE